MTKIVLPLLVVYMTILGSCKKHDFLPQDYELQGHWIEKTDKPDKHKLIFAGPDILYFIKANPADTSTFHYRHDKKQSKLYLSLIYSSLNGESSHKVNFSNQNNVLTIYSLFDSIPGRISMTRFEKDPGRNAVNADYLSSVNIGSDQKTLQEKR